MTPTRLSLRLITPLAALIFACGPPLDDDASSTGAASQQLVGAPSLGAASGFAVLGASTVTCTNASTTTGDVGVSPGTAITGFNPDCTLTGALHAGDAAAAVAHNDLVVSYAALGAAACEHNLTGSDLGGMTLAPGVYCFDSSVGLTGQLTLDGGGDANAVWIFQIGSTITTASNSSVVMAGSGQPCNAFWRVGSSATLGTGTAFQGNVLAYASITLTTGTTLIGRALALNAAVTMDQNSVSLGGCSQQGGSQGGGSQGDGGAPSTCPGKDRVSGSGWIKKTPSSSKDFFSVKGGIKNGMFWGGLIFKGAGMNGIAVRSQSVTGYQVIDATTRRIQGAARVNGQSGFTYAVDVSTTGSDSFSLAVSNGYSASGTVGGGTIRLFTKQAHGGSCNGHSGDDDDGDDDHGNGGDDEDDGHGNQGHSCGGQH